MAETIVEAKELPEILFSRIRSGKVRIREKNGSITLTPIVEKIESSYTYEKSNDLNLVSGTSQVLSLNLDYPTRKSRTIFREKLQTLFGDPSVRYSEGGCPYEYILIARNEQGARFILTVHDASGWGPAIGGNTKLEGIEEAVEELKRCIESAEPLLDIEDGRLSVARNFFEAGLTLELIACFTKIPLETLQEKLAVQ